MQVHTITIVAVRLATSACAADPLPSWNEEYLDKVLAEPFEKFNFPPAGAAIYQLGPFGTAA